MNEFERESLLYAFLGWRPGFIARTATRCSVRKAWLLGTIACALQVLAPASGAFGWISEPFPNLTVCVLEAIKVTPFVLAYLMLMCGSILGLLAVGGPNQEVGGRRWQLIARVGCLSPLATLVPGLIWSVFAVINDLGDPALNIGATAVKPVWVTSPLIQIMGSRFWLPVGLALMIANGAVAYRKAVQLLSLTDHPRCTSCGYDLTGNVSGICPECGLRIE